MIYRMGCFPPDKVNVEDLEKASNMVSTVLGHEGKFLYFLIWSNITIMISTSEYNV